MTTKEIICSSLLATLLFSGSLSAQTTVPNTFISGTPASAVEVNDNFAALEQGIQNLESSKVTGSCSLGYFVSEIGPNGIVVCGGTYGTQPDGLNTRFGKDALLNHQPGPNPFNSNRNVAVGTEALVGLVQGTQNTAIGFRALATGGRSNNTAVGTVALEALIPAPTGDANTAIGSRVMSILTEGGENTAVGNHSLVNLMTGNKNTVVGADAMLQMLNGSNNTGIGYQSLYNNTGNGNIALGFQSGMDLTTGDSNIAIGSRGASGEAFTTRIGSVHTRTFIAGIRGTTTDIADGVSVVIDSNGQLGTISSSRRYKQDISDMGPASDRLLRLRPVTFRYSESYSDGTQPLEFGLIAEEVAEVFPELVVYNDQNEPESIKYRLLSSLLLNELKKQNDHISDQRAQLDLMHGQIAHLYELVEAAQRR